jgi:2-C-methyl-D-erythritol 4-phosphate cytidylyltransferase / 2-C-methyl-D-erythritol 2,4-cyclodiphosphate synthase
MTTTMQTAALIVAAGRGTRVGGPVPKQYRRVGGRMVLTRTLEAFLIHPEVDVVQPVTHPDDLSAFTSAVVELPEAIRHKLRPPVSGRAARQESVREGLIALSQAPAAPDLVLIHDGARPFVEADLIARAVASGRAHSAAVPGVMVTDTIAAVDERHVLRETLDRSALRAVQTPQAFAFSAILEAHERAAAAGLADFPDDGAVARWAGLPVTVFEGDAGNVKLTRDVDFVDAERRLGAQVRYLTRVGTGFDVHAFAAGDHVWLGGVKIPADRGVAAHSDGDVVLHALTDALLGAIADGDIGTHFPPSDPQWRGASSDRFLAFAAERVRGRGGLIDHFDVTVLCEAPRIGPHRDAMRWRIADIAGLTFDAVSIKATTTERLGFIGRAEGIAAQAATTIRLPETAP